MNFRKNAKPRSQEKEKENGIILEILYKFFEGKERVFVAFESKIFLRKSKGAGFLNLDRFKLNILTPKQMQMKRLFPYQTLVFITHKSSCNNNKLKTSAPTWNDKFELPDGSYSAPDIQDYFDHILKNHGENTDKPSIQTYVN